MEQRDFILREIEKIGQMLQMILEKLKRRDPKVREDQPVEVQEVSGLLLEEMGYELKKAAGMDRETLWAYLHSLRGFSVPNVELLADLLSGMGFTTHHPDGPEFLNEALRLYEFCRDLDRNYSIVREQKITEIHAFLSGNQNRS